MRLECLEANDGRKAKGDLRSKVTENYPKIQSVSVDTEVLGMRFEIQKLFVRCVVASRKGRTVTLAETAVQEPLSHRVQANSLVR